MDSKELKLLLKTELKPYFNEIGFEKFTVNEWGYNVTRKQDDITEYFTSTKLSYGYYLLQAGQIAVIFNKIEDKIKPLAEKHDLHPGEFTYAHQDKTDTEKELRVFISSIKIGNHNDFLFYKAALKGYFTDIVLPFFAAAGKSDTLLDTLKSKNIETIFSQFGGQFPLNLLKCLYFIYSNNEIDLFKKVKLIAQNTIATYKEKSEEKYQKSNLIFNEFLSELEVDKKC